LKKTEAKDYVYIGVDVSKEKLDAYRPSTKKNETFSNQEADIETFCKSLKRSKAPVMVVVEGTGGYESLLVRMLTKHKVAVAVVNARQVRDFANGIGMSLVPFDRANKLDHGTHKKRMTFGAMP
jgi:transposase